MADTSTGIHCALHLSDMQKRNVLLSFATNAQCERMPILTHATAMTFPSFARKVPLALLVQLLSTNRKPKLTLGAQGKCYAVYNGACSNNPTKKDRLA